MNAQPYAPHIRGFTLFELMITMSVMGVLLAVAVPSFISSLSNNTIIIVNNELLSAINLSRSEAIKRNVPVSICATQDSNFNACGASWQLGWLVFVNPTGGTTLSNTATAPLLRIHRINNTAVTLTPSPSVNIITYNGSGFPATGSSNITFTTKATGCTIDSGRSLAISITGRPVITRVNCP